MGVARSLGLTAYSSARSTIQARDDDSAIDDSTFYTYVVLNSKIPVIMSVLNYFSVQTPLQSEK